MYQYGIDTDTHVTMIGREKDQLENFEKSMPTLWHS